MNKWIVFGVLLVLSVVLVLGGWHYQTDFLKDVWSQLFWITVTILFTTFIIEQILRHGEQRRQRDRDAFALRTFSARMMTVLQRIVQLDPDDKLFEAAQGGDQQFRTAAQEASSQISNSKGFAPPAYSMNRLDIASGLRTLAINYISSLLCRREGHGRAISQADGPRE